VTPPTEQQKKLLLPTGAPLIARNGFGVNFMRGCGRIRPYHQFCFFFHETTFFFLILSLCPNPIFYVG